jgi:ribosome-binding factor A
MSKLERLESTIQRALTDIYRREVKDDHIGFLTITECRLTNDYSYLTIYYTILGQEERTEAARKALERSKSFVRSKLAQRVKMRKSPNLIFKYDESLSYGNKISTGLKEVLNNDSEDQ